MLLPFWNSLYWLVFFPKSLNKEFVVGKIEKERGIPWWGEVSSEAETQCSFFFSLRQEAVDDSGEMVKTWTYFLREHW